MAKPYHGSPEGVSSYDPRLAEAIGDGPQIDPMLHEPPVVPRTQRHGDVVVFNPDKDSVLPHGGGRIVVSTHVEVEPGQVHADVIAELERQLGQQ